MPRVNPAILRWARETAGLTPEDAARKIELSATRKATTTERIADLEEGRTEPSRPLLLRMSKQYRRPLIAFYLAAPPRKGDRGEDFRTLPEDHAPADEVLLDALLRDMRARQSLVRAAIEDEDSPAPLPFIGSLRAGTSIPTAVSMLREALRLPIAEFRSAPSSEEAFDLLRERAEDLGVFVLLLGNLGSHHTALSLETFRGLAIADPIAPFVVLNDQDSRAAWSFSLIHELTHLWLGQTGISGGAPDRAIERFCNDVAAEYLLPGAELVEAFRTTAPTSLEIEDWIGAMSERVKVSRTMIAFRLYSHELISTALMNSLRARYREQWLANRERRRQRAREATGGPNFYVVRRQRLGRAMLETAHRLLSAGALTTGKTARILGVKPTQVGALLGIESPRPAAGKRAG